MTKNELLADPVIGDKKFERAIGKLSLFEGKPRGWSKVHFITAQSEGTIGYVEIPVERYTTWKTGTKAVIGQVRLLHFLRISQRMQRYLSNSIRTCWKRIILFQIHPVSMTSLFSRFHRRAL